MSPIMILCIAVAAAYLYGSIPFGVIIGKLLKGIDIRQTGSGNIGTSNAFRALGPVGGTVVFLADLSKGILPLTAAAFFMPASMLALAQVILGAAAIVGHNYSLFLKFKGGKGIATSFGVFLAINWKIALICFGVWIFIVCVTRISSLGSLAGAISLPVCMFLFHQDIAYKVFAILAALMAVYAHRENIKRLISGTELKMSTKEKKNITKGNEEPK